MKPTLLVLAAGMGSRYGGLKQMDGVGPDGETIIDYSIYDAVNAGFGKVVYIVRESFLEQFRQAVMQKYSSVRCPDGEPLAFEFVTQELSKIPSRFTSDPAREKPWGTGHAVLMGAEVIDGPFTVINGDDYYGRDSFAIAADWCNAHCTGEGVYAIVGFQLGNTLSENGTVSRGVCSYDSSRCLTGVVEHLGIKRGMDSSVQGENSETHENVTLPDDTLVSMNMWCFTPDFFRSSASLFEGFLEQFSSELKKEFYLPFAVDTLIKNGQARCEVLATSSKWFGVTYKEDRPGVVQKFRDMAENGFYPRPLLG